MSFKVRGLHTWYKSHHSTNLKPRQMFEYLIEAKADVNVKDEGGHTPLTVASLNGRLDFLKCLVDAGADINMELKLDFTPLMPAVGNGHLDIVKSLLEAHANANLSSKVVLLH